MAPCATKSTGPNLWALLVSLAVTRQFQTHLTNFYPKKWHCRVKHLTGGWLNQPIWKVLVKMGIFPNFRGEHQKSLKPPPSWAFESQTLTWTTKKSWLVNFSGSLTWFPIMIIIPIWLGSIVPYINQTNQGFEHCSFGFTMKPVKVQETGMSSVRINTLPECFERL